MRSVLKNVSLLAALVVVVYLVANYAGSAKTRIFSMLDIPGSSVKGASTEKAEEISEKFKSDIGEQVSLLQKQALNVTLGDAITVVSRLQKIPQDFQTLQEYTTTQLENFTRKK